jgi:hypothetical protein
MSEFDWEYYLLAGGSLALAVTGLLFLSRNSSGKRRECWNVVESSIGSRIIALPR